MLKNKLFQVRDSGTNISVLCIEVDLSVTSTFEYQILRRAGYGDQKLIIYVPLVDNSNTSTYDPHSHHNRTRILSHKYIIEKWNDLKSGSVIDVEYILGETSEEKHFE